MKKKERNNLQKEILNSVPVGGSGRLLLAPRCGKTKIIIDLIKRDKIQGKILWVTPTSKLADEDIPAEFIKWKAKKYLKQLETTTWRSLHKCTGNYDLIIFDEEQFITENNSGPLIKGIQIVTNRLISMTGTESKNESKKSLYFLLNLKVLHRISIKEAVDVGLLSNYDIKVVMIPLDDKKNIEVKYKCKKTGNDLSFKTSERAQYEYQCARLDKSMSKFGVLNRMNGIKNSSSKLGAAKYIINSLEGKKLIFAANTKQAEELSDFVYHSKTDDTDLMKFIAGETDKIAMVNKGGTGYTYMLIDNLIVTQIDSDNNGLTSQKIARTLLKQGEYKATIWLLCLEGTQDEIWLQSTLSNFDKSKVEIIKFKDLELCQEDQK